MAIVVVIAALVAEQPKKHSNQRITREGIDMGTMMYRFDGSKVLLSVKLEEMLAGIGIPDDAISFDQIDGLMAFTECYEQFSGRTLLKRLVPDSGPVLFAKSRREESGANEAGNRVVQFRSTIEA